jgi:hypothetical protein
LDKQSLIQEAKVGFAVGEKEIKFSNYPMCQTRELIMQRISNRIAQKKHQNFIISSQPPHKDN